MGLAARTVAGLEVRSGEEIALAGPVASLAAGGICYGLGAAVHAAGGPALVVAAASLWRRYSDRERAERGAARAGWHTVAEFAAEAARSRQDVFPVVGFGGELTGVVLASQFDDIPASDRARLRVDKMALEVPALGHSGNGDVRPCARSARGTSMRESPEPTGRHWQLLSSGPKDDAGGGTPLGGHGGPAAVPQVPLTRAREEWDEHQSGDEAGP